MQHGKWLFVEFVTDRIGCGVYTAPLLMPARKKSQQQPSTNHDPHASREASRYANPVASREFILSQLELIGEPVSLERLAAHLKLAGDEQMEALRRRLKAMSRDGQIISNRRGAYGLTAHMDLVKGTVQGTRDGVGYFIPDDRQPDMFLPLREMARLFDGDQVLARCAGVDARGRKEAAVVEILQRRHQVVVGRFYSNASYGLLVPDNKRIQHEIVIAPGKSAAARDGQYVVAKILEYPARRRKAIAQVIEVLGEVTTPGVEIDIALHGFAIPHRWSAEVRQAAAALPTAVRRQDLVGRHDLRSLPFVTIDGEDARDFDDAVCAVSKADGGWTLWVAIADVSHYVEVNSALDQAARERGTSVYFPGHVIPMLPEKISNGLCSLQPGCDRLAMVCELTVSAAGRATACQFHEAVIHSHARLSYDEVAAMLQAPTTAVQQKMQTRLRQRHRELVTSLDELYALYKALHQARIARGAIDFDSTETRMVFGEDRKIRQIVPVERNDAHRLIEECMLAANVAAAELLQHCGLPALYRVHAGPDPAKLPGLREFLAEMGLHLGGGKQPTPVDYQRTIMQTADRPDRHVLQTVLIKSMLQAVYQAENTGHFGLAFAAYTHFTSPIRRFPDLLVHRAIRYLIRNRKMPQIKPHPQQARLARRDIYPYSAAALEELAESCSTRERRADAASYHVMDWLKCEYMQHRVGEQYSGTITTVTGFGLFVELDGIHVEGLVHISELRNDYYHFDPIRHSLQGERGRKLYRLGDTVTVRVARVDIEEKKIDLQMLDAEPGSGRRRGRAATGGKAENRQPTGNRGRSGKAAATEARGGEKHKAAPGRRQQKRKTGNARSGKPDKLKPASRRR